MTSTTILGQLGGLHEMQLHLLESVDAADAAYYLRIAYIIRSYTRWVQAPATGCQCRPIQRPEKRGGSSRGASVTGTAGTTGAAGGVSITSNP